VKANKKLWTAMLCVLAGLIVCLLLLCAFVAGGMLFSSEDDTVREDYISPEAFAEEAENVDYNRENGRLYVNNEVVVYVSMSASMEEIEAFMRQYDGQVDASMADIGIYRLVLREAMTYEALEALVAEMRNGEIVEDAFLNSVVETGGSVIEGTVCPMDPWNGAYWDDMVPRDENWGMWTILPVLISRRSAGSGMWITTIPSGTWTSTAWKS